VHDGTTRNDLRRTASVCFGLVVAILLGGCTGGFTGRPVPTLSDSPSPVGPHGLGTDGCGASRPAGADIAAGDLVIGPLSYPGLQDGYENGGNPPGGYGGIRFFKIGAQLPPDSTATVSIGASARAYAGIETEAGPDAGYSVVTYQSCPATKQNGRVFWVGGFTLVGRASACVPIEVAIPGENAARKTTIALPAGACD
jgi:hypothetical protein